MEGKLLYHIWRKSILHTYHTKGDSLPYPPAYYFAIANEIYPYYQRNDRDENLDFDKYFELNHDAVTELILFLDKDWRAKDVKTFYEYEDILDVKHLTGKNPLTYQHDRLSLRNIIRYCHLNGCFDKGFYTTLLADCPSEAHSITKDLNDYDIMYY